MVTNTQETKNKPENEDDNKNINDNEIDIKGEEMEAELELGGIKKEQLPLLDPEEIVPLAIPERITNLHSLGNYIASKDNSQNFLYFHEVPDICKSQPCVLGVDEAGRGPVLGPMVYGIAFCPLEKKQVLVDLGCADSKQLTEEKRELIFVEMNTAEKSQSCIGWAIEVIAPNTISTSMNRRSKCSLNEVSMNSAIELIHRAIDAGVNIAEVYVDTVGPPEKYQDKLKQIFPQFVITVAKKADSTYPIVSAASICAKVSRDHALKVWTFPEGIKLTSAQFGSGYPGDPNTKRFLSENIDLVFGFPRLVRFSWSTAENALADKAYELEFDEPNAKKTKYDGPKLTEFFRGSTKTGEIKRKPSRFFAERFLNNVVDF